MIHTCSRRRDSNPRPLGYEHNQSLKIGDKISPQTKLPVTSQIVKSHNRFLGQFLGRQSTWYRHVRSMYTLLIFKKLDRKINKAVQINLEPPYIQYFKYFKPQNECKKQRITNQLLFNLQLHYMGDLKHPPLHKRQAYK